MSNSQSTAEGFLAVLKALPKTQRDAVVARIARDGEFSKDIVDLATLEERRNEPTRPFRDYLKEKRAK
ncbi:MAG: hypothetical protein GY851_28275 [bacterium]|nr:hypothetical protein [bacterium]